MKLTLGVLDIPHSNGQTTGDIAEILEAKYHIMATFFAEHAGEIVGLLEAELQAHFEDVLSGHTGDALNTTGAESAIEGIFRAWLASRGMDGKASGVPTEAARKGVNHRFKHPYAKGNPSRPSFIDTGLYIASFKCVFELDEAEGSLTAALVPAGEAEAAEVAEVLA